MRKSLGAFLPLAAGHSRLQGDDRFVPRAPDIPAIVRNNQADEPVEQRCGKH